MADDSPSSVRLPGAVIPFTADLAAVERSLTELEEKFKNDLPEAFAQAVAQMESRLDGLKARITETLEPMTTALDAAGRKIEEMGRTRQDIGTKGLEDRKPEDGIQLAEVLERFASKRPEIESVFASQEVKDALRQHTELLEKIAALLETQEGA